MNDDSEKFWIVIAILVIAWLVFTHLEHWAAQVFLVVLGAGLSLTVFLAYKSEHLSIRLLITLGSFCGFILLFASFYYFSYRAFGRHAFRVSSDMEAQLISDSYQQLASRNLVSGRKLVYLPMLLPPTESLSNALSSMSEWEKRYIPKGTFSWSDTQDFSIDDTHFVLSVHVSGYRSKESGPVSNKTEYSMTYKGLETSIQTDFIASLKSATPQEIIDKLEDEILRTRQAYDTDIKMLDSKYVSETHLSFSHFLYYSGATMTTVGSNDLNPNNDWVRFLTVIQGMITFILFSICLTSIWEWRTEHPQLPAHK